MNNNNLVSYYELNHHKYQTIHSAGPEIFFSKPCIGYVIKGYADFFYNGSSFRANEGDLIYIAFEPKYQSIWYGAPDIEWYSIGFDFISKFSFYDYRFQILKNYPPTLFEKMYETYQNSPMESISYFYLLLNDIYSKMNHSQLTSSYLLIEPAVKYIENNFNKEISITTLEKLCNISKSTLFNHFKNSLGVTPIAYKHNIMIQKAIDLLSNTDIPIEEISSRVGFSSSNYFRKVFSKLTGKTPKELRKYDR